MFTLFLVAINLATMALGLIDIGEKSNERKRRGKSKRKSNDDDDDADTSYIPCA